MADHPNVELMRKGYEAYAAGDIPTIEELFADDIKWHTAGRGQLSGDYEGKVAVFGVLGRISDISGGTAKIEVHDILANDTHAVVLLKSTASKGDVEFEENDVHIWHIEDGKCVEFWDSPLDQYTSDEFWQE